MYNIGDTVMYPGTGVCRIENIVRESFVRGEERTYYVLKAVYESGGTTIYCPVDSENVRLRGLLSREAIDRILSDACAHESLWVENALQRKKAFLSILKEDNGVRLLRMLIDLHEHHIRPDLANAFPWNEQLKFPAKEAEALSRSRDDQCFDLSAFWVKFQIRHTSQ